jgi:hypothetical protein
MTELSPNVINVSADSEEEVMKWPSGPSHGEGD